MGRKLEREFLNFHNIYDCLQKPQYQSPTSLRRFKDISPGFYYNRCHLHEEYKTHQGFLHMLFLCPRGTSKVELACVPDTVGHESPRSSKNLPSACFCSADRDTCFRAVLGMNSERISKPSRGSTPSSLSCPPGGQIGESLFPAADAHTLVHRDF